MASFKLTSINDTVGHPMPFKSCNFNCKQTDVTFRELLDISTSLLRL